MSKIWQESERQYSFGYKPKKKKLLPCKHPKDHRLYKVLGVECPCQRDGSPTKYREPIK